MVKYSVWLRDQLKQYGITNYQDIDKNIEKKIFNISESDIRNYFKQESINNNFKDKDYYYNRYLNGIYPKDLYGEIYLKNTLDKHFRSYEFLDNSFIKRVLIRHKQKCYLIYFNGFDIKYINKINPRTYSALTNGQILKGKLKMSNTDIKFLNPFIFDYLFFEYDETKNFFKVKVKVDNLTLKRDYMNDSLEDHIKKGGYNFKLFNDIFVNLRDMLIMDISTNLDYWPTIETEKNYKCERPLLIKIIDTIDEYLNNNKNEIKNNLNKLTNQYDLNNYYLTLFKNIIGDL